MLERGQWKRAPVLESNKAEDPSTPPLSSCPVLCILQILILVHHPAVLPEATMGLLMPQGEGMVYNVKLSVALSVSSSTLWEMSPTERDCYFPNEKKLDLFSTYTQESCHLECRLQLVRDRCGCQPYFFRHSQDCMAIDVADTKIHPDIVRLKSYFSKSYLKSFNPPTPKDGMIQIMPDTRGDEKRIYSPPPPSVYTGMTVTGDSCLPPIQGGTRSYSLPLIEATLRSPLFSECKEGNGITSMVRGKVTNSYTTRAYEWKRP
uniref:Uncharacterized protein n=1 Tax=Timema monikensis TaxID=170555 RepID=A0A7R9HRS8_9NEOP|nr:unnamed protein product [Timema monikensis]